MSRRHVTDTLPFDTLRLEGSLFVPELLERAARGAATAQKEADYATPRGLKLHDEYGRAYRIAGALWQDFAAQRPRADLDAASVTRRFVIDFLHQTLGYDDLALLEEPVTVADRGFPVTAAALGGRLPVIIASHSLGLDDPDPGFAIEGSGAKKKSAHQLAQEYLNATPGALWAIVCNGRSLRLLRDAETLTRPNFLEFDLEAILGEGEDRYADFSALWRILHASRAGDASAAPAECIWEQWKGEGHAQGLRVREGLRNGVQQALLVLGSGFLRHPANDTLRQNLHDGSLTKEAYFEQLLRLIYRSLFLFCAEERELLHPPLPDDEIQAAAGLAARRAYAAGYSVRRFRLRSLRQSAHDPHGDLWISLKIVFRALAGGQELLALPALGGLFAETQCPDLDDASLSNRDLLSAMRELRWFFDKKSGKRSAIDYRNMGPEELGSVYESLLELVPTVDLSSRDFGFAGITDNASSSGNARKTTGSYYTPDSLVQELIKSALEPVIRQRLADARELALLPWATLAPRLEADPTRRAYVQAYLVKHAALTADASREAFGRAWDAIPAAARANPLCAEALLALTVCDPACGSGHFLLAAARRLAERLAELRAPDGAVRPDDYRHALREVASRCLYGVDINPMAVELCRVALWLETVDPGKPLGFLDHHIRCGNSLLGTTPELIAEGLPDDTFKAIEGDDKAACAELKKRNKKEREGFGPLFEKEEQSIRDRLRQAATQIEAMDDSQPDALHRKEVAFTTNETSPETRHAKLLADLWCAAFVIKKAYPQDDEPVAAPVPISDLTSPIDGELLTTEDDLFGQPVSLPLVSKKSTLPKTKDPNQGAPIGITTGTLRDFVRGKDLPAGIHDEVEALARQYRFFHWHLAFPQVFAHGGFDCILGNPPWERPKPEPAMYFASKRPEIADAQTSALRDVLLKELAEIEPQLFQRWIEHERFVLGAVQFQTASGAFTHSAVGKFNLGNTFVERSRSLLNSSGRAGLLNVSGLATDDSGKELIADLMKTRSLVSFFDFENREALFHSIHRSYKFSAITIAGSSEAGAREADFVFFAQNIDDLHDPDRHVQFSAEDIELLNPISGNCPVFRERPQAEIVKALYRRAKLREPTSSVLWDWNAEPTFLFVMSDHSDLFATRGKLGISDFHGEKVAPCLDGTRWLPLYESKMFHQFEHRWASLDTEGNQLDFSSSMHLDPQSVTVPRYWMRQIDTTRKLDEISSEWLIAVREVTNATNERTTIATVLPKYPVGHNAQVFNFRESAASGTAFLATLNSFVLDFATRTKVGGSHLSSFILRQLPILPSETFRQPCRWAYHPHSETPAPQALREWLLPRVLELTYTAWDLEPFAQDCGWPGPPFRWDEDRRFLLRCELDAAFFHLYLGPQSEWQQQPEALTRAFLTPRDAVSYIMDTFPIVKRKDEAKHGSYRTKDTILQIYDALGEAMETGVPYQTRLDPPPADPVCCHPLRQQVTVA
jgi:hypothetical protein